MSEHTESKMSVAKSGHDDPQGSGYPDDYGMSADPLNNQTPFSLPPEELIFTFKEQEKLRKVQEREANKRLKVWEKNRPTREGCLRKLCETDIEPSALAINPKVKKKINVAEAAGFNVPVER